MCMVPLIQSSWNSSNQGIGIDFLTILFLPSGDSSAERIKSQCLYYNCYYIEHLNHNIQKQVNIKYISKQNKIKGYRNSKTK